MRRWILLLLGAAGSVLSLCLMWGNACLMSAAEDQNIVPFIPDEAPNDHIKLPYRIPGTQLVAQNIASYEGPYLEDGSGDEVVDIAAIILKNTGTVGIEKASVELLWDNGKYHFEGHMIPAGESILVLESSRQSFKEQVWKQCRGIQIVSTSDWSSFDRVTVAEAGMGKLLVENISDTALQNICVTYKDYLSPPGMYIGGICYSVVVPELEVGAAVQVPAWHYARGNSRVVYIGCEERIDSH